MVDNSIKMDILNTSDERYDVRTKQIESFREQLMTAHPGKEEFSSKELSDFAKTVDVKASTIYHLKQNSLNTGFGQYNIYEKAANNVTPIQPKSTEVQTEVEVNPVFIPEKNNVYVRWGCYPIVDRIIKSGQFYPFFITGLSGNGKTIAVEQACANNKREYVRIQVTPETDETDLIGTWTLVDGDTIFQKGPVIQAMERGAILLIDEIDRGTNRLMALQGILEGKPVLIKKTNELITPRPGFNIIATGNTKGTGSEDGRFSAATILDDAFLERFVGMFEQTFPDAKTERKILANHASLYKVSDPDNFIENLISWATTIRKTYADGGVDEVVSTRRLCHIIQSFSVFRNSNRAIKMSIAQFDDDTQSAFLDLYNKINRLEVEEETEEEEEV